MTDFDEYYEATEPGRRERAYAWATAIGLQDVDGLKPSRACDAVARIRTASGILSQQKRHDMAGGSPMMVRRGGIVDRGEGRVRINWYGAFQTQGGINMKMPKAIGAADIVAGLIKDRSSDELQLPIFNFDGTEGGCVKKGIEANSEIIIRAKNVLGKALGTKTGSKPPDSVADCANAVVKSCLCDSSVLSVAGVEYKLGTKSMRMEDGGLKIGDFACECERYEQAFCRPAAKKKYVYVDAFECVDVSEDEIHVPVSGPFDPQCVTVVLSWRSDKFSLASHSLTAFAMG